MHLGTRGGRGLKSAVLGDWCWVVRVPILDGLGKERRTMYQRLTERLGEALAGHIREKYGVELAIVLERPPKIEMGEAASPVF